MNGTDDKLKWQKTNENKETIYKETTPKKETFREQLTSTFMIILMLLLWLKDVKLTNSEVLER